MDLEQLTGTEKAAILVLSLPQETVKEFLARLSDAEVERILATVARFEEIPASVQESVLTEFCEAVGRRDEGVCGGRDRAREIAESALDESRARDIRERLGRDERRIDWTLRGFEAGFIAETLSEEHPQTIALVLSQIPVERGATVIAVLPDALRAEVVTRLAELEHVTTESIADVEEGVAELFGYRPGAAAAVGGTDAAAKLLNRTSRAEAQAILEQVQLIDPELAGELKKRMLTFNDLSSLDKRAMQTLLREVAVEDLVVALKLASDEMKEKIFANVSARAGEQIREEAELLGPMKIADVERVQQQIVDVARRLEDEGRITIDVGGGQDALV